MNDDVEQILFSATARVTFFAFSRAASTRSGTAAILFVKKAVATWTEAVECEDRTKKSEVDVCAREGKLLNHDESNEHHDGEEDGSSLRPKAKDQCNTTDKFRERGEVRKECWEREAHAGHHTCKTFHSAK